MSRSWLTLAVAVAALCSLPSRPVAAETYYVDPLGDDAGAGSAPDPWRTIGRAAGVVQPGDVVVVQPGTYVESVGLSRSGSAEAAIEYRALPGAVLESPNPAASLAAFDVGAGVGHLVIDGFAARGGFHETIQLRTGAHDVVVRNCELSGNRVGVWVADATDVLIDRCSIHNNSASGVRVIGASRRVTVRDTVSAFNDDGLGCSGDADGFTVEETAADVAFVGARAEGNAEDGFDIQGDAAQLTAIDSRRNGCTGIKLWQNAVVENAVVIANRTGISASSFLGAPISVRIVNSTVADNTGTQIFLGSAPGGEGLPPVAYGAELYNVIVSGPGKAVEAEWPVTLVEGHNLLFRADTTRGVLVLHREDGTQAVYTGQQINAGLWAAESGQGAGTLAVDPEFADTETYGTPADGATVDRGATEQAPPGDRAGNPRPMGNGADVGPDEVLAPVDNHRPWADPGPERTVTLGGSVRLQAYGSVDPDGDALTYEWDLGDGSVPVAGYEVRHTYAALGDYTVSLTASDGLLSRTRTTVVHVVEQAVPTDTPSDTATPQPDTPTPTATPIPDTPTPIGDTPTPTATWTPETPAPTVHDSEIRLALAALRVNVKRGVTLMTKRVRVVVRNADVLPVPEDPGHPIRVVVEPGTCPPSLLSSLPDFFPRRTGAQDVVEVRGGRQRRATLFLTVERDAFFSPDADTPSRCTLRFRAEGPGADPTPENNVAELPVEVVDYNDF